MKVSEKERAKRFIKTEDVDEITQIFIEATELDVNIQELLTKGDEFLSQKITVFNINDKVNVLLENQQKQPSRGVLRKRCSENMSQIYRTTPMPRIPMLSNFIEIALRHGSSPVNLLHIFGTTFPKKTSGWLLLNQALSDFRQYP